MVNLYKYPLLKTPGVSGHAFRNHLYEREMMGNYIVGTVLFFVKYLNFVMGV